MKSLVQLGAISFCSVSLLRVDAAKTVDHSTKIQLVEQLAACDPKGINITSSVKRVCPYGSSCEEDDETGEYFCIHKDLFPPNGNDIAGFLLIIISTALAAGGGIGGGGLLVPIFWLVCTRAPADMHARAISSAC